jgi:hypothetical protein
MQVWLSFEKLYDNASYEKLSFGILPKKNDEIHSESFVQRSIMALYFIGLQFHLAHLQSIYEFWNKVN